MQLFTIFFIFPRKLEKSFREKVTKFIKNFYNKEIINASIKVIYHKLSYLYFILILSHFCDVLKTKTE